MPTHLKQMFSDNNSELSDEQKLKFKNLISEFADIFSQDDFDLGCLKSGVEHKIHHLNYISNFLFLIPIYTYNNQHSISSFYERGGGECCTRGLSSRQQGGWITTTNNIWTFSVPVTSRR